MHERNLADRERLLGPDHPDTLTSRNNLALAYGFGGSAARGDRLARAQPRRPRAAARPRPPRHPDFTQQPRRWPTGRRVGCTSDRLVRAQPRRPRATARPGPPRHLDLTRQPRRAYKSAGRLRKATALHQRNLADPSGCSALTTPIRCPHATTSPWPTGRRAGCTRRLPFGGKTRQRLSVRSSWGIRTGDATYKPPGCTYIYM